MPDFLQLVSMMREQMNATLSRSDVLKPLAWLVGILSAALAMAMFAKPAEWVSQWLLISLLGSTGLYGLAFIFCLIFDRDALRSEKYSLHKMAIEHGLIGDSSAGLFEIKETKLAEPALDASKQIEHKK